MQPRDPNLAIWIGALFAVFAVAIALGQLVTRRRIDGIWRMFAVIVATTTWMLGSAWLGGWWFIAAIALTSAVTAYEMAGVVARLGVEPWRGLAVATSVALAAAAVSPDATWLAIVLALAAVAALARPVFAGSLEGAFAGGAATLMASVYPGLFLAFALLIARGDNALGDIVFLFVVLEVNDANAFLVGRLAGRRPYAPVLSPNKTIEGATGGAVAAVAAGALLAPLLPGVPTVAGALIGLALAALGQTADLAASAIKRQARTKDFASTIPTQGGVLDVYDAFIMALPIWFLFTRLW